MPVPVTRLIVTSALALVLGHLPALAASDTSQQHNMENHNQMNHNQLKMDGQAMAARGRSKVLPTEPGQGAFATIAEIVVMLTNDPLTEWSKVDIGRLREHLVDMDELILRANSKTAVFGNKMVFTITGTGRTLQAIQAMIPAHAGVLTRTTAWDVKSKLTDDGAILIVSSNNPVTLNIVKALGFYGVMATGAHHQAHHLAMAKGDNNAHAHN